MANILLVDDSRTSRKILRNILESAGHTIVDEATDGAQAIEKYIASKPDVITLDITMPVMDGIEALKQIKLVDSDAKVIMVSASSQKDKLIEAVKYGAEDFIAKPFEPSQIITVLDKLIS